MEPSQPIETIDIITKTAQEKFNIQAPLPYQRLVINSTLCATGYYGEELALDEPKERIIILPTGAGKSLCFMLPSFLIDGIIIVIFPLLSLISDQHRRCQEAGIPSVVLKGGLNKEEKEKLFTEIKNWKRGILLTNMESLLVPSTIEKLSAISITQIVFDEAHTLFEWGDNFREALQRGGEIIEKLKPRVVDAFTATASLNGIKRIESILFPNSQPVLINANPDRPNITYHLIPTLSKTAALRNLFGEDSNELGFPKATRPAILFSRNRMGVEKTAGRLKSLFPQMTVYSYHAGYKKEKKSIIEKEFFDSDNAILCSTNAYGMGVDKSNIRTVIHTQLPPTIESYLQESGRAGRDKQPSHAFLLITPSDLWTIKKKQLKAKPLLPALQNFILNDKKCRRESLLEAMGQEEIFCSGCDVCNDELLHSHPKAKNLFSFFKKANKLYSEQELCDLLKGKKKSLFFKKAEGMLKGFSFIEIDETLKELKIIRELEKRKIPHPF